MKITIESTAFIASIHGAPCRLWHGITGRGARVRVFVRLIAAESGEETGDLDAELIDVTGSPDKSPAAGGLQR